MSEATIIAQCSPTLAGIKTGSLFSTNAACPQTICAELSAWNRIFSAKGISFRVLKFKNGRALIYLYRKSFLAKDLLKKEIREILSCYGYHSFSIAEVLRHLTVRFAENDEFPHEIGLFLGYPPADVKGFIENRGENPKCTGLWKVYTDEAHAQMMFCKYKRCTDIYSRKHREGTPITRLAISV